jgi:cytochrome c1
METNDPRLAEFFAAYETRTNSALQEKPEVDVEAVAGAFTDCFIEANPKGVICGKNDEEFRAAIPKGFDFYRSIGTQSVTRVRLPCSCRSMDNLRNALRGRSTLSALPLTAYQRMAARPARLLSASGAGACEKGRGAPFTAVAPRTPPPAGSAETRKRR